MLPVLRLHCWEHVARRHDNDKARRVWLNFLLLPVVQPLLDRVAQGNACHMPRLPQKAHQIGIVRRTTPSPGTCVSYLRSTRRQLSG